MAKSTTVTLEDDLIRVKIVGHTKAGEAKEKLGEAAQLVSEQHARHKKALILVDMTDAIGPDVTAKRLTREFLKKVKYDRIAIYGSNKENKKVVQYVLNTIMQRLHVKTFRTEAQALRWLRRTQLPPRVRRRRVLTAALVLTLVMVAWIQLAVPYLLRLPENFSYDASVVSYDNFYDEQTASYSGKTLSDTQFTFKAVAARDGVLDVKNRFDVRTSTGEKIFAVERLYGINQQTGEHVPTRGDHARTGYLFAPRNLDRQDFTYWHINYDEPAVMKYQDDEDILGLKTYRYEADYQADQTKDLTSLPGVGVTRGVNLDINLKLWIEPTTGTLVKYEDHTTAYYYDLATGQRLNPWNQFSNSYSFDSISAHVKQAEQQKRRQDFISTTVPVLLVMGVVGLLVYWAVLVWRDRRFDLPKMWARVSAVVVAGTALAVLAGWATNNMLLVRLSPSFSAMHVVTAGNFLLLATVMWLLMRQATRPARKVLWVLLASIGCLQLFYFATTLFGVQGGLEALLRTVGLPGLSSVSPITAICFTLVIVAISTMLIFTQRWALWMIQVSLLGVMVLAIFAIAGYAFSLESLYSIGWFRSMALHTALLFVVVVSGIFMTYPEWEISKRVRKISRNLLLALAVLITMLLLTGLAWQQTISRSTSQAELQFQADSGTLETTITSELSGYINALQGAKGLFAASNDVSRTEWKAYVDSLQLPQNYPGMLGLGYAEIVPADQKVAHIAKVRQQGYPSYTLRPEGARNSYAPVVYLEPFNEVNQRAFGYDMYSEPIRREAMDRARDTGEAALSGKIILIQDGNKNEPQSGVLLYLPVYKKGVSLASIEQRRSALVGYVYTPIRVTDFMRATVGTQTHGVNIGMFDASSGDTISLDNRFFVINKQYGIENRSYVPKYIRIDSVEIAGRTLTFRFSSLPTYDIGSTQTLPGLVLFVGLVFSFLFAALVFSLGSSRSRALMLANDMTLDLRHERNAAITNQHKNEAILGSIGDGVFVLDPSGKILLFNKAAEAITGFAAAEATGQFYKDILHFYSEKDGRLVAGFINEAQRGTRAEMARHTMLRRKDGTEIPVADSAAPIINARGGIDGVVVVFRDVSRARQLENMKDEFLSIASHELRTPMGAVRANVAMMLDGDYGPVNKGLVEPLSDIHHSTVRLVELVTDLLNVARIEAGRMKFIMGEYDTKPILQEVVTTLAPLGKEKSVDITIAAGSDDAKVQVDPDKLKQVLTNLIGNALKFTDEGRITVASSVQKDMVEVAVTDTGIGIAADEQGKLFSKFSQISSAQKGKPAGTGLGLYISREIMRKMGGDLWLAHSKPGKGSTFTFTIPCVQTARAKKTKKLLDPEAGMHPDQK